MRRTRRRLRRAAWVAGALALAFLAVARPVDDSPIAESVYYRESSKRLEAAFSAQGEVPPTAALMAGAAKLEIAPPIEWDVPVAGNRRLTFPRASGRRSESVWARAVVLSQGVRKLVLVSADILVISPAIRHGVLERLRQTLDIEAGELLLVASHTHGGPGGYWDNPLAVQTLGPFDERVLSLLIERISAAAVEAWHDRRPATVGYASIDLPFPIRNRAYDQCCGPENPALGLLRFEATDGAFVADLVSFSAHPTTLLGRNELLSGDYPGIMAQMVDDGRRLMIFVPGSIGDMKPVFDGVRDPALKAQSVAGYLVREGLDELVPEVIAEPVLESFEVELMMPPLQPRLFRSGLLGSWVARAWLADRVFPEHMKHAVVQVVRIGPVALLGSPSDLASSVALPLIERAHQLGLQAIFISMAEDWIGYVLPRQEYLELDYNEDSQFHGPQSGELFEAIYARLIDWLAQRAGNSRLSEPAVREPQPRVVN